MATVVSTINLKGGVGKTQTTVALGEFLVSEKQKKVLVVDLDPQTNATFSLMSEEIWLEKDLKGETMAQVFQDALSRTRLFNLEKAIVKKVSNVGGGLDNLHLLPSSLQLISLQDQLGLLPYSLFSSSNQIRVLEKAIAPVLSEYDFILIDCPPNLGLITLNGLYFSDYYLIPCIPDVRSTYGINQIINRMNKYQEEKKLKIKPLGIVISMFQTNNKLHKATIQELKSKASLPDDNPFWLPPVFETPISLSSSSSQGADFSLSFKTLKQKYGYGAHFEEYENLTKEFLRYVGEKN